MPEYRRINQPGGLYFFTVVSFNRLPLFSSQQCRDILHFAWHNVQSCHPFETIALCLLPEHIHAIWQRRYWAHVLFDQNDLNNHIDYVHINPLKHGLVNQISDWPWSTFHGYLKKGIYPIGWGGKAETPLLDKNQGE